MLLDQLQDNARNRALRSVGNLRVGPFVLRLDEHWDSPFVNYAIPDAGAEPTAAEIAELITTFEQHKRRPRLEYLPACAPALEHSLLAAGFLVENRATVMCAEPSELRPAPPVEGVTVRRAADQPDLTAVATVQHHAYGEQGEIGPGEIDWLRATAEAGGLILLAVLQDGTAAGAGLCSAPLEGISELVGLAVVERHRRRGIGAAVASRLTADGFELGYRTLWLEPGDEDVQRMYARLGYRVVGEKLNISRPS
jgi:ribosomal protein S18 acetylase RimI-like enzyme